MLAYLFRPGRAPAQCLRLQRRHASCWPRASRRHNPLRATLVLWRTRAPDQQGTAGTTRHEASAASIASPAARCHPVWRVHAHRCLGQLDRERHGSLSSERVLFWSSLAGEPRFWIRPQDKHARAGNRCEMLFAVAAPTTAKRQHTYQSGYHRHHQVMFVPIPANIPHAPKALIHTPPHSGNGPRLA